jgi:mannose-6-phosphate isomerase-like protein (cupin superfamily)
MAHFLLRTGHVSRAVRHKTVEPIGYIISERGEMWRANEGHGDVSYISAGTCLTILLGIIFQFRPPRDGTVDSHHGKHDAVARRGRDHWREVAADRLSDE